MSSDRTAEIEVALRTTEGAGALLRCKGWSEWLKPWIEGEIARYERLLKTAMDWEQTRELQIKIAVLQQVRDKPEGDLSVNQGILGMKAGSGERQL